MNALATPFRQLVERKLWPLAILLIAALAAVPMLLAKDDAAVPAPPVPSGSALAAAGATSPTQPIVSLGDPSERESSRKVLGARKNPFEPKVKGKKAPTATGTTASTGTSSTSKSGTSTGSTGGSGAAPAGGGTVKPGMGTAAPALPVANVKRTYELYSLKIRFGQTANNDLANRTIKRLTALPKMSEPTLVYLGLKKDLKTAVFLVDSRTMVIGDGTCRPDPSNCQTLEMRKGQTAFIDVLDATGQSQAQYELDMVGIVKKQTTDSAAAKASRKAVARGGRRALRANVARVNGWRYDARTGHLRK